MNALDEIRGRWDEASSGPWMPAKGANPDGEHLAVTKAEKAEFLRLSLNDTDSQLWLVDNGQVIPAVTGDGPKAQANATAIAHAPTDIARLLATVQAALDLADDFDTTPGHRGAATSIRRTIESALEATA